MLFLKPTYLRAKASNRNSLHAVQHVRSGRNAIHNGRKIPRLAGKRGWHKS